jgi:predicted AlkP superfamily pyrophosphatase or phosphodiesterase
MKFKLNQRIVFTALLFVLFSSSSFAQKQDKSLARPRLVVGFVVDQMRWDYLYRYYDRYSENGFKRFLKEGFSCENAYINYVPTVTAVGHSTVYTGSVPAIHGIAGNDFIIEATGKNMYCTEDDSVQTVGSSSEEGRMSPRNLLASTITDELMLSTNFRSKVIGIALKDRGAILPAGHRANAAYWFDDATGNFISSTWYMKDLPDWVRKFNDKKLVAEYLKKDWTPSFGLDSYAQSSSDDNAYEGKFSGATTTTMPVKTSQIFKGKNFSVIRTSPFGNTITLDFAKAAVESENLGKNTVTDFLTVSCSSTDYIGHKMGVNAIETEDTYIKLDKDLADFLSFLDQKVGKGNYTIFLTADHGAAHNPNFLQDNKIPAGFWVGGAVQKQLNQVLEQKFNVKNLVTSFSNYQVHFNNAMVEKNSLDESALRKEAVNFLRKQPNIAFVADINNIEEAHLPALLKERVINGYNSRRSGPITFVLDPGYYSGSAPVGTGTTHGTWNPYDAHIPLLWYGWGVQKGSSNKHVNMTDIAPTVAAMLHIQEPNGCIGKPIEEVIKK